MHLAKHLVGLKVVVKGEAPRGTESREAIIINIMSQNKAVHHSVDVILNR